MWNGLLVSGSVSQLVIWSSSISWSGSKAANRRSPLIHIFSFLSFSCQVSSFLGTTPRSLGTRTKIDMQISLLVSWPFLYYALLVHFNFIVMKIGRSYQTSPNQLRAVLIVLITPTTTWQFACYPYTTGTQKAAKISDKNSSFNWVHSILTGSMNTTRFTNLFTNSCHLISTNGNAPA